MNDIIDAQIHLWEADHPGRPWQPAFSVTTGVAAATGNVHAHEPPVTRAIALAEMDRAGVAGAIIVSPALYGYDPSYALETAAAHPQRFRVVGYLDHAAPDIEARMEAWRANKLVAGFRVLGLSEASWQALERGDHARQLRAAEALGLPMCICPAGHLSRVPALAAAYPRLSIVIDHLGLVQSPMAVDWSAPFAELPKLLALAALPNVTVKLSAMTTLSRQPFPFPDLQEPLRQIIASFGADRLIWGSDFTRARAIADYAEAVRFISENAALSAAQRQAILGGTLRRVFGW